MGECGVSDLVKGKLVIGSSHPCSERPDNCSWRARYSRTVQPAHNTGSLLVPGSHGRSDFRVDINT